MSHNPKLGKEVVDAVREGYGTKEIADLLGYSSNYTSTILSTLVEDGSLVRLAPGKYALPMIDSEGAPTGEVIPPKPVASNGNHHAVERDKRVVQIPEYMRTREAVTLSIERESEELEEVVRLEICVGGQWFPQLLTGDVRIYVGIGVPKWSAYQIMIDGVTCYRVTFRTGQQMDYAHNPNATLVLDQK